MRRRNHVKKPEVRWCIVFFSFSLPHSLPLLVLYAHKFILCGRSGISSCLLLLLLLLLDFFLSHTSTNIPFSLCLAYFRGLLMGSLRESTQTHITVTHTSFSVFSLVCLLLFVPLCVACGSSLLSRSWSTSILKTFILLTISSGLVGFFSLSSLFPSLFLCCDCCV